MSTRNQVVDLLRKEADAFELQGGMGLIAGRKAFDRPMAAEIKLISLGQDVYLDSSITLA
jgi:DhnA family fructose-bisphosphate aldolase class Ia